MEILKVILTNGFIPFIPILIWNILFVKYLPAAYNPKTFDNGIPKFVLVGEGIFRIMIFLMPFFIKVNVSSDIGKIGLIIFLFGVLIYFTSWILIIKKTDSKWCNNIIGFTAPAHTIIIWLIGFSLMAESYYFDIKFSKWYYIVPSILMTVFHTYHSFLVYKKEVECKKLG